jgi:hypothetical protein
MKRIDPRVVAIVAAAAISLTACVAPPAGPTIAVAPGPKKSFDAFAADQAACQQYASAQTAPGVAAANNQAVGTALITTALGAGLGAAVGAGGWRGNAGRGAGIGAASGAVVGTALGAGQSGYAQMSLQQQYDITYGECMSAHGHSVPGLSPPPGAPPYGAPGRQPYAGPPGPPPYSPGGYSGGYPGAYPGAPVPPPPGY